MTPPRDKLQHFDGLTLAAVVAELRGLGEARIDKVGQASHHTFYLSLRAGRDNHRLLINLNGPFARLHLTQTAPANLPVPLGFTMQLRKHLEGSRLLRVEQADLERVVKLVVAGRDELGDPYERWLMVELIGKYANMFLVESQTGNILGCLRPVSEEMCGVRQLAVGLPYDPPPVATDKVPFLHAKPETFRKALGHPGTLLDALMTVTSGLSRISASQLLEELGWNAQQPCESITEPEAWVQAMTRAQNSIVTGQFEPRRLAPPRGGFSVWGLTQPTKPPQTSHLLEGYYAAWETANTLRARREKLQQQVREKIRKQRERLKNWEKMREEGADADRWRKQGDLLASHLHRVEAGSPIIRVTDYYAAEPCNIDIPLDTGLTPSENVQRLYRRYRKAKKGHAAAEELLHSGQADLIYLQSIEIALEMAQELSDLEEIAQELAPTSLAPTTSRRLTTPRPLRPLRIRRGPDCLLLVGKNNRQNDHVTFKEAHAGDWWVHTRDHPGAHVIIRADGPVSETTLHEAAMLAAWFSPARHSAQVPVVYARKKHVKKVPGGRPGMVIYEQAKTLFVTPADALVAELLTNVNLKAERSP